MSGKPIGIYYLFLYRLLPLSETNKESLSDIMSLSFLFETEHHLVYFHSPVQMSKISSQNARFSPLLKTLIVELYG